MFFNNTRFSLTIIPHIIEPKYGVVSQMPLLGDLDAQGINVADNMTYLTNRTAESAEVGYFRTTFETTNITIEVHFCSFFSLAMTPHRPLVSLQLTASEHAGILHYTFPTQTASNATNSSQAHVLVDLAHALPSGGSGYIAQRYIKGSLSLSPDGSGYSGSAWYDGGWNQGEAWQICRTLPFPVLNFHPDRIADDGCHIIIRLLRQLLYSGYDLPNLLHDVLSTSDAWRTHTQSVPRPLRW